MTVLAGLTGLTALDELVEQAGLAKLVGTTMCRQTGLIVLDELVGLHPQKKLCKKIRNFFCQQS